MAILSSSNNGGNTKGSNLWLQVIVAIVLGGLIGAFSPQFGISLEPLGKAFVNLVKMIIAPVIFLTIATGIAGMRDLKGFGSVTVKAFAYFFVFSTFALILGLVVANVFAPGVGMNAEVTPQDLEKVNDYAGKAHDMSLVGFLSDIIPRTFVAAFVDGNILQVLFISVIFGISLVLAGEKSRPIVDLLEGISHVVFRMVDLLMKAAPIGAFGAIAYVIGKHGIDSIVNLSALVGTFYITSALFIFVVLGTVAKLSGFSIFKLIAYLKNEIFLVLGTSSSESALPSLMEKMEQAGVKREIVGLVVPTGYSFNLDGTNIYMTLAALFIAQATNTPLTMADQLALFSVAIISSKGAAGVTGAGFITLAATLSVVPTIPVAGMAIILGVDKFMSECRALTNFIGNAVATIVIGKWENGLNKDALDAAMAGKYMPKIAPVKPHAPAAGVQAGERDSD